MVDRPALQYVVDEAREAGIEHFIFVTGRNKTAIEDHFDIHYELYETLSQRGKNEPLERMRSMQATPGRASFTRQQAPLGLGHAVWCARDLVGDEPFAVLLPDMIMEPGQSCLKGMVELYGKTGDNVIAVEECDPEDTYKYGIVAKGAEIDSGFEITGMVEKPAKDEAPSNLFINGRYILQPEIFDLLENQERGAGGEIQLTDSMLKLGERQKLIGYHYRGESYDCGSPEGFIEANLAFALRRDDLRETVLGIIDRLRDKSS